MSQIKIAAETAPSTPESGYVTVYAKTDKKLYLKDDAGTETDLTAGSGGSGDVVGPASANDGNVALFDGITGKLLKQSTVTETEIEYVAGVTSAIQTQIDGKQPLDDELTALAGLTSAADKLPYFTGAGTAGLTDLTTAGRALLDDADAAAQRTTLGLATVAATGSHTDLSNIGTNTHAQIDTHIADTANPHGVTKSQVGLGSVTNDAQLKIASNLSDLNNAATARTNLGVAIGTDVQAYDAELAAIAGLTSAANKLPYFTGSGTAALTDLTAAGRALIDDADAAAQRATLGVGAIGQLATLDCSIDVTFDGQGSAIIAGSKAYYTMPFAMTISTWTLVADQSGSAVIDVWKSTYSSYPPVVGGTIAGSEKPTLSSVIKNEDTNLTTWSTSLSKGDALVFNIDSASTVTKLMLSIRGTRVA